MTYRHRGHGTDRGDFLDYGPIVSCRIHRPEAFAAITSAAHLDARVLIDTGGGFTGIDEDVLRTVGLPTHRIRDVRGATGGWQERPTFRVDVSMLVFNDDGARRTIRVPMIEAVPLRSEYRKDAPYLGFLGRDFLDYFQLVYDGPSMEYELVVPPGSGGLVRRR